MREIWDALQKYGAAEEIKRRFSVRGYDGKPLDDAVLDELMTLAKQLSVGGMRVVLEPEGGQSVIKGMFGRKSGIDGVCAYASFVAKEASAALVGYAGEAFILACTALGLGTVWIGGTMDKRAVKSKLLREGEKLYCIAPVGRASAGVAMPEKKRMTMEKLTGLDEARLSSLEPWQKAVLDAVRIAPSAMNRQPWRCVIQGETIAVHTRGSNFGFGELDTGIARLHRDAVLLSQGREPLGYMQ